MQPRVAVVIRTKDRGRLLARALDSVLGQTYSDWQIVVVNDGGSTEQVDQALEPRLSRLGDRVVRLDNEASLGMEAASNLGIRAVDSEFIAVHDDDDEWAPEFLATTVAYLDEHPDHGGVSVETDIVFERLTGEGREVEERVTHEPDLRELTLVDLLQYNRFVPISFLFRRSVYNELGGFDESLAVVGDWEFHLRFLVQHHVGLLKGRPLAFWNQRRSSRDSEANSVISGADEHQFYSLKVRDRLLREYAQKNGIGPLLYQRELLAAESDRIHHRMDEIQRDQGTAADHLQKLLHDVEQLQQRPVPTLPDPLSVRLVRAARRRLAGPQPQPAVVAAPVFKPAAAGSLLGPSIAVLGDVGQNEYHVGDEAMAHAAVDELQKRGFGEFVVLTHDVEQSARLFGQPAARRPDVPWNAYERHQLLQEIKALLAGHASSHQAADVVRTFQDAFTSCHSLLLAGGGNLTSQYGGLLFERLAAIHTAHALGMKVLVSGQTVGPVLTDADRAEAAEAFKLCTVFGSRERHTHELLDSLGVPSQAVLDDATYYALGAESGAESSGSVPSDAVPSAYIAATFAPASGAMGTDDYHRHMARLLDLAHEQLNLPILLLPHVSTVGEMDGDQGCHRAIARLAKVKDIRLVDQKTAVETAALTAGAELVVSSRYHPVIFALSAGVPVLPVAVDYYAEVRIGGALENWGLRPVMRSLRHLADDADAKWVNSVIGARADIAEHLQKHGDVMAGYQEDWWNQLAAVLRGTAPRQTPPALPVPNTGIQLMLEPGESRTATRLNANNEVAIGLLGQHADWLHGRVHQLETREQPTAPAPASRGIDLKLADGLSLVRRAAKRVRRREEAGR